MTFDKRMWKKTRRKAGYRDVMVWLTPEAVDSLGVLKRKLPGRYYGDIINTALMEAAQKQEASK